MEEQETEREKDISCFICQDILKEPVAIPCGHSFCKTCISNHWDAEKEKHIYTCPQCKKMYSKRPALVINITIEELLNKKRLQHRPDDQTIAAEEDVSCDFCTERKLKAIKSCLKCAASFCEKHLQPHHESEAFKRHKLVDPSKRIQEIICYSHDEAMKMFCRTDKKCICVTCSLTEHKGHDIVSAETEWIERQRELKESRNDIFKHIENKQNHVEQLKNQETTINRSADYTVQHSEQMFTEVISLFQKRSSELEKEIRSKQQTEVSAVRALQVKLEKEIVELKNRHDELQVLSRTDDHIQFVLSYSSLSALSVSTHSNILTRPEKCFEEVTAAVSELREHVQNVLREDWTKVRQTVESLDVLQSEPTSRANFLKYSQKITLDPNTAHMKLRLSEGNRKVTKMNKDEPHPDHPNRFMGWVQVLSRESLTGRCYWEVEWKGGGIGVSVAYKSVGRANSGKDCWFGHNNKSWRLKCLPDSFTFRHNGIECPVQGPPSSRIGVYVDHKVGILSFYSVSETMTLLHRVHTTFTEPLYAGLFVYDVGDSAKI